MTTPTQAALPARDELTKCLLALPPDDRLYFAKLLTDSVRDGFTSLEEAAARDKQLIRSRLEQLVSGEVELLDAEDVVADLEQRYAQEEPA